MDTRLKDAIRATLLGTLLSAGPAQAFTSTPTAAAAPVARTAYAGTPAPAAAPVARAAPAAAPTPAAPVARASATAPPAPRYGEGYPETLQGGQSALDSGDAASAAWIFARVAASGGKDAQSALYWQAYAEHRSGRVADSLRTLDQFDKQYPQSRWTSESRALRVELMAAQGKPTDPKGADEELKLYALDGLMQMEPARALPILKKFLAGNASPRLKERALFIASQADLPEANALVLSAARDGRNPDLQRNAIMVLAQTGDDDLLRALRDVYKASTDPKVKNAVIDAYMMAGDEELMLEIARGDPDPQTRGHAAEMLGAMGATDALRTLYKQEKDPAVRQRLANGMMMAGETDALLDVAKNEQNPKARRSAILMLGQMGEDVPDEVFEDLYRSAKDPLERDAVIDALMMRESAAVLVKLFRLETDPARKRRMLQALSQMESPEAEKLVMEILEK